MRAGRRRPATGDLRGHLEWTRLAGEVATTPRQVLVNCSKARNGSPDYSFGLPDVAGTPLRELVDAVRDVCGGDPGGARDLDGPGWIDPDRAVDAIERHRRSLAHAAAEQATVLVATGHPTGLLAHYAAIVRALQSRGCAVATPLDDTFVYETERGRPVGIRFTDGVGGEFDGANLRHTHRPDLMERMLDATVGRIDLVIADHGLAGAAIARGLPTLSIADVNDPALPLAQARGLTNAVLPLDDNLAPRHYLPVTEHMLDWG
ncbi:phosphatase [Egibacter rhizosphaerae]|uniref:phosphatase n=1 Tax=Egibacter rhizosphaerae TaxID=1670831 RepID=UPI0023EA7193|nr:phosphatase [Egibacter rhizosphaerae]